MGIKKALYFVLISASFFFFSCFSVPDPGCDSGNCVPKMSAEEQAEFFKTFIAVGDSISYGCQGLNMEENRQFYSFTAQIARSMNTEFNQPLVEFPGVGIPNPEDAFKNGWLDSYCQSFNSLVKTLVNWKRVDNFENQDSLNCFAATGATLDQMLSYDPNKVFQSGSSVIQDMVGLVSPFIMASIGGRDIRNHKSLIDQALDRDPSFLSVWIGNNDTMYATVLGDPGASTSVDFFQENWNILVDKIKATSSIKGIAVINLPDNTCVPLLQ
ncbi:MAG: SGNH/GDSL hydrolase family protein, partial [bacterium]|nr:SGNH/GDSL hydrolase family protein [bacterium]